MTDNRLEFTYSATSATVTGVGRYAGRMAKHLTSRPRPELLSTSLAHEVASPV